MTLIVFYKESCKQVNLKKQTLTSQLLLFSFQEVFRYICSNKFSQKLIRHQLNKRFCSGSARLQEAIGDEEDDTFQRMTQIQAIRDVKLDPIRHDPDVGQHFKVI